MLIRIIREIIQKWFGRQHHSSDIIMDKQQLGTELGNLSKGLLFFSESEYPLELQDWGKLTNDAIADQIKKLHPEGSPLETLPADAFFEKTIRILNLGGDDAMTAMAARYHSLWKFISTKAGGCTVWRCGKIEVGIYIVITTGDDYTLVLKTTSVET